MMKYQERRSRGGPASVVTGGVFGAFSLALLGSGAFGGGAPLPRLDSEVDPVYWVYVVAESEDEGYSIRFDGKRLEVRETIAVGMLVGETEAPHGIDVAPDGMHWYASIAHGFPRGYLRRYDASTNRSTGQVELGMFPSSVAVDPSGTFVYVANSNFHGDMVPSSISVIFAPDLIEAAQVTTCTMPHGSRFNTSGTRHYSACMMDDQLVEINTATMRVERRFNLAAGAPAVLPVDFLGHHGPGHGHAGHGASGQQVRSDAMMHQPSCSPTWVQPAPNGREVFVTCNRSNEIVVVDLEREEITRRLAVPERPYNVDVSPDGRVLIVTHRRDPGAVTLWNLESWTPMAELATGRSHTHGIAVSPDSRFAFVTAEGVRGQSGTLDVIDLSTGELVDRAHLGKQSAGVAFWRMEGQ